MQPLVVMHSQLDPPAPPWRPSPPVAELLRRLALHDERCLLPLLGGVPTSAPTLDRRTESAVRLAALLASDALPCSCRVAVEAARAARLTDDEIVAVLVAIAPALGGARLVSVVPALALALDYDLEAEMTERR